MVTKLLGIADIAVGIVAIIFEISFLAARIAWYKYMSAAAGIWGGVIFAITGVVAWKKGDDSSAKTLLIIMSALSTACGVVLLGLTAAAIDDYSNAPNLFATELGLESVLLVCGISAIAINGLLLLSSVRK